MIQALNSCRWVVILFFSGFVLVGCGGGGGGSSSDSAGDISSNPIPPVVITPPQTPLLPASTSFGAQLSSSKLEFPAAFMPSVKDFGAVGDGVTDDTAAIQRALNQDRVDAQGNALYGNADYNGRPKALYFPAGTYLVSNTLRWVGCCLTLQGQGSGQSFIRLKSNAAGFGNKAAPKAVIETDKGNESFRQNIWDLSVIVSSGNPGAIGINHASNNTGLVKNVLIRSEDGAGVTGLNLTREWSGPNMFKNIVIEGFDLGIDVAFIEYSQTYQSITLRGQKVAAIRNNGAVMAMRNILSDNTVPALLNDGFGSGLVSLMDAHLNGGAAATAAIKTSDTKKAALYLRNVQAAGYARLLDVDGVAQSGLTATERYSGAAAYNLFDAAASATMLKLPVSEVPEPHDNNLANWVAINCYGYGDCPVMPALQAAFDSGKSTIYFPFGNRITADDSTSSIRVPASVKRIVGLSGVVNLGGIKFIVDAPSVDPLVIEGFGYGVSVQHSASRTVVLKHGIYAGYSASLGAGDLIGEDIYLPSTTFVSGQRVWLHHVNNEDFRASKFINDGASLWIHGMKTERARTVVDTRSGGRTEYLGGLLYTVEPNMGTSETAFIVDGSSSLSAVYGSIVYSNANYLNQLMHTKAGVQRALTTQHANGTLGVYLLMAD
jgi:hypothetical protein